MNFIKQIENALMAINEAKFQDLINHLLHIQGNTFIAAPGSAVGKEKTKKGAPDSFFVMGHKYVFVECTTKDKLHSAKTFLEKLEKDIEHCFNESKTGIKVEQIEKIILACTGKINADEYNLLLTKVEKYNAGTKLEIYNIQNLPMHIYDFPGLSEQYLGVEIIKGEIYNLPDFLIKTTKGLQPSLTNDFTAREEELKQCLKQIDEVDVIVLTGLAGVGKSKLGVQILEQLKESYIPIVIQSSAVPLWDDFINLFQNGKDYIILFDDANKSIQNLNYLISFIQKPKNYTLKVVVTVRDYVKHQVYQQLRDCKNREVLIERLKDEDIEKIIIKALPNLQYYYDIKKKIIELSKGNARLALMATYSVTPHSETNYLNSPVLLYEKYFEKVSDEIEAFVKPNIFRTLAIVSFFGVLNRNNSELQLLLKNEFDIDWDELWSTILELHRHEVLDVYSNEIVKVSDQVLATYAFYKYFIDSNSPTILYSKWIKIFLDKYPNRIKSTLIDINNTFNYYHVKELVIPHLDQIITNEETNDKLYSFYTLFWFYKGYDTLIYLKKWIDELDTEYIGRSLEFSYEHNNHTKPSKYFELLIGFWHHRNELLKPAVELAIDLVAKQPHRLPEYLKFVNDYFSYRVSDIEDGYQRQKLFLEILQNESRSAIHTDIAKGTFLCLAEVLLGWHFTEFNSKGIGINIINFDLYSSTQLLELRQQILNGFYIFFDIDNEQTDKILNKIVHPGGNIDKQIYVVELPIYDRLISDNLSPNQHSHCKFVSQLTKKLILLEHDVPKSWKSFTKSQIAELSKLLKTDFLDGKGKTWQEREELKRLEIEQFIKSKTWKEIVSMLSLIETLHSQQKDGDVWQFENGISEIFIAISKKGKSFIKKVLSLVFTNTFSFTIQPRIIYYLINSKILSGKELLSMVVDSNYRDKESCILTLLECLPEEQIDVEFMKLLIYKFSTSEKIYVHRLLDYIKYNAAFEEYKALISESNIKQHNIISYLTQILLQKQDNGRNTLGHHFCRECAPYLKNHINLLKQGYIKLKKADRHFDYDGEELQSVLDLDNNFFIEFLNQKAIDDDYLSFKLETFKLDCIWLFDNYREVVFNALEIIIKKAPVFTNFEHASSVLFTFDKPNDELLDKAKRLISEYISINFRDRQKMMMIMLVVLYRFSDKFSAFLKEFLVLNKDIEMFKYIWLNKSEVTINSRVPYIQREIDFIDSILAMVKTLPNILDYVNHIKYLDQKIIWLKKDIEDEQKKDFVEYME